MLENIPSRSSISSKDKWNVESLFPSLQNWETSFNKLTENPKPPHWPKLASYRGRLNESSSLVKEVIDYILSIERELKKLYTYAHLRHDEEITLPEHKAIYEKISNLAHAFHEECSWFEPEILSLPQEILDRYLQAPELAPYRFRLEKIILRKPHTLTSDKEELLAIAGKALSTASSAFSSLNNADLDFGTIIDSQGQVLPLSHGLYQLYLRSPDRVLRQNAFKKLHNTFGSFENTITELLRGQLEVHAFEAKARKYSSSLEAALFPKNIPTQVYHSLIQAVREGLPILHRYISLRKKALKLSDLHLYDMYLPMLPEVEIKMDYDQAQKLVIESVAPLGQEYQSLLSNGLLEQRWVDRYENKNKRSGAYSSGCYDSYPYILMNYRGILRDVFTLAHEVGHSMQSLLSNRTQPFHYSHYPIFVAEVASTFNETLLTHLILQKISTPKEKAYLIQEKLEDIRGTLFRQTMFAEFELKLHELVENGTPITPLLIKEIYKKLNIEYFGPEVIIDDEIAFECFRIPHFYYNFYVYQYATGLSASLSLAEKVLHGETGAQEAYLNFLKSGGSRFPIDLLKLAGVDMTSPIVVTNAIQRFHNLVQELESLMSQI